MVVASTSCIAGFTQCGGGNPPNCVNLQSNAQDCGSCGTVCPSGHICAAGTCATGTPSPTAMTVTPGTSFSTTGFHGGPFAPNSVVYTVTAASGAVFWELAAYPNWLTPSATSGNAGTGGMAVTFTVNSAAASTSPGQLNDYIEFYNTSGGTGGATLSAQLNVLANLTLASTASSLTQVGQAYSQTNVASGGTTPYAYSVSAGALPAGVSLNASTGTVSGTPTAYGAFSYTIEVSDSSSPTQIVTKVISGAIAPATLTLASTAAATTQVGQSYSQTNVASGGTTPLTYSVSAGVLPYGATLNASTGTVSGTPTTAGAFSYAIKVTDSGSPVQTATQTVSGAIAPATLTLVATASSTTQVAQFYRQTNVASGGATPYTYTVSAGALPAGLTLNASAGAVFGTPTASGAFSYTIKVTDSGNPAQTATQAVSGTITPATLTLASAASAATQVGQVYSQTNVASGGTTPYTYALSAGALPAGVTLNASTGTVSGTPTMGGAFSYTIAVTDSGSPTPQTAMQVVSGTVTPPLTLVATASSATKVGQAYSQANTASGGATPYTYSVSAGLLPAGVTLNTSTGVVSGTPTAPGAFNYVVKVTDSSSPVQITATQDVSGTIAPVTLTLVATASSTTQVGQFYRQTNVASGGATPYTYTVSAGALPAGLTLNASTGTVFGTPTASGAFSYTVEVTDSGSPAQTATQVTSGAIAPATLTLTSTASATAQVGQSYSQSNVASGGTTPYTYAVFAGALPAGATLNASTGTVSGTPTAAGAFSYTIKVADSGSPAQTATQVVSGAIAPATLTLASTASSTTQVGRAYSQSNVASGGTTPYTYAVSVGELPAGATLNVSTGTVSGTPTAAGAFSYSIKATDSGSPAQTATQVVSGMIAPATLTLTATASSTTQLGQFYRQTNVAGGGTAPYTYSLFAGSLPPGATLNTSNGAVYGTLTTAGTFTYTIEATDSGSPAQTATASITAVIPEIATSTTVIASPSLGNVNQSVSFTATVTPSGVPTPTGTVTFNFGDGTFASAGLSSGQATIAHTYATAGSYSVTAAYNGGSIFLSSQGMASLTINPRLVLSSTASATTQVGQSYSQTNVASGGTMPYTYSVSAGALPAGATLNTSTGTVSGTPTTAGAFSYTIKATDSVTPTAQTATQVTSGAIAATLTLTATASSTTQVGQAYSQSNAASGGTAPYTYSVSAGAVPAGVTLNASTGAVSGTPTAAGAFSYAIKATDSGSPAQTATQTVSGTIAPATLTLTSTASATTQVGQSYSQSNVGSGGTTPYTYSVFAGLLPAGTTLNASTGTVSGTPTAAGAFSYSIKATDNGSPAQTATQVVSGTIAPATLTLAATASSATKVGQAYSQTNAASGGTAPYTYSVSAGAVPAGVTLNAATGAVSGTPTAAGAFSYTIKVTDSGSPAQTATQVVSGAIAPATLTLAATASATAQVGQSYSQSNVASGGTTPYTYAVSVGELPAGATLNASTGTVSGTPTAAGAFSYTIKVTDSGSPAQTATQVVSGAIAPATLTLASTASSATQVGQSYSQTNAASGGTTPYTYTVSAGALPAGATLSASTGTVSGTPTAAGAFSYAIKATDSGSPAQTATQVVSGTIAPGAQTVSFTSTAPTNATVGGPTYTPTAKSTSGLTVALTIDAASSAICSISGGAVSFQAVGTCIIDANQAGNANYNAATQVQQTFAVGKGAQTVSFTSTAPTNATVGGPTYTPTAKSTSGLTVALTIDRASAAICSITSGAVRLQAAGTCIIDANQAGNANYNAAPQVQQTFTVGKAITTTALSSSQNPSTFGQSVTFTATVTSGGGAPTGTVTFKNGSTTLGTGTLASGVATFSTATLSVGSHSITAAYAATTNFGSSTSSALTQTVKADTTATALFADPDPSTFGQSVTFTAVVASIAGGIPTGTVTFKDGSTTLGAGALSGAPSVASFRTATLSGGSHAITAVYDGTADFAKSVSSTLTQTVNAAKTATALTAAPYPSTFGKSVTFTATVTSSGGTPAGTVTFQDGTTTLGNGALASGVATFSTSALSAGAHTITAAYGGASNFAQSTSPALTQTVNPPVYQGVAFVTAVNGGATNACVLNGIHVGDYYTMLYRSAAESNNAAYGGGIGFASERSSVALDLAAGQSLLAGAQVRTVTAVGQSSRVGPFTTSSTFDLDIAPNPLLATTPGVSISGTVTNMWGFDGCTITLRASLTLRPQ